MSNAVRHHFHFSAETPHILPLSFVDEFGRELDVSHYEISGMVLQQGQAVSIEAVRPTASTAVVTFPKLVAGSANYRVDITSPAGTEIPMIYGTIHVMGRESAPSGADELDAISVSLPTVSEQDVTIKILGALDLAQFGAEVQQAIEEVKDSLAEQKKYAEAMKDSLAEHANDAEVHATADEKAAWNAKLSPSDADARYGLAGTIPGQVVNGQSFSTNYFFTGNRQYAKSVDFEAEDVKNLVMQLDVDTKMVSFFDATVVMNGIAFFHTLYTSNLSVEGVLTGTFSGTHRGSFSGNHYGQSMLFSNIVEDFQAPGWRLDKTNSCVDFKGVVPVDGKPVITWPMSINYAPDNQKVDVATLEVKGQTVLNPSSENDEVLLATFKANDAARYELRLRQSDGALRLTLPGGGSSIFSCNGSGKMFALRGFGVQGDFTAQSATFSGDVVVAGILNASEDACVQGRVQANKGIYALPLGKKTALGADAFGLSVSADGGLQLWGTHFMQGSIWGENGLKMVQNEVSLTSTDSAAIGFDYANTVDFRTMPNDGDGHGVYRFQCWKWSDDSHTAIVEGAVDVRKKTAMQPSDESLLNRSENDARYGRLAEENAWSGVQTIYAPDGKNGANKIIQIRDASGEYPGYNICFRNGGSLEIFDENQNITSSEPYFQIYRTFGQRTYACQNFCVKGTTELRKSVTLPSTSSLTTKCPATFQGAVTFAQAPVLAGMFEGQANSLTNAYSSLGLSLLSPLWVQTAYFNNVVLKAGTANVSNTVGVRGLVHWSGGNASVSAMAFLAPSAESNVYGGLEGFWQPIHFYTSEGWVKVSFGVNSSMLTSAEYTVSDFALNEKDVFVYTPTAVQSNSFNAYVDITFMRTSSTKTTVRTRLLKKASNSSTWYLEEQVAEIPSSLAGWGNSMQGFGGARNAEKNKVLFFVHHGSAIYKVAEFESPWLFVNDSKVNFVLSAGDLAEKDYSYTTIENQRIYMRADLFGGELACPFFEVLNNCAQNVITTITEPVIYETVSSDVE